MELTQIQWQNPWQKTPIGWNLPVQIGSNPASQIVHPNLDQNSAQIVNWVGWVRNINPTSNASPVIVNWQRIWWPTQIQHWDTISVWKNNDVILGVNKPWEWLSPWVVWRHLWNLNFTNEQIEEITKRLFNPNANQLLKVPIYGLAWILVFLIAWVIYWFFVFSDLNTQLTKKSKALDNKIAKVNLTIGSIEKALWIKLDQWEPVECYEDEDCSSPEDQSIGTKINEIWKNFSSLNAKISEADAKFAKLKTELTQIVDDSLKWEKSDLLKQSIEKSLTEWPIKKADEKIEKIITDFTLLDKVLWDIVKEIQDDVDNFSTYSEDLKSLKEVRKFITDFDAEKALSNKKFILIENDINNQKNESSSLGKKINDLDSTLKATNEKINSIDLKINNLSN